MSIKRGMENEKVSLALLLAAALAAGCGGKPQESQKEEAKEEDKLQIGLSFDSFVIERWLRDRDMFVSTAQQKQSRQSWITGQHLELSSVPQESRQFW